MNRIPAFIFLSTVVMMCMAWTFSSLKKNRKYTVSGTIMFTHDYCGGVAPAEDQKVERQYPVRGTKLYVRRMVGTMKCGAVIDSVVCDSAGNFSILLAAGTYRFDEKWKTEPLQVPDDTKYETWDSACYVQQYLASDYTVTVKGNVSKAAIVLRRHCSWTRPCCSYHGPMPPGAAPTNKSGNQPGHQE